MDRRYSAEELASCVTLVEGLLAAHFPTAPTRVMDTVVLGLLRARLEQKGADLPIGLERLKRDVQQVHGVYVQLCAEGPYEGLPVA